MNHNIYRSRLTGNFNEKTARFVSSLKDDDQIFEDDINGTEAHNIMLHEQGIISRNDLIKILSALEKLRSDRRTGKLEITPDFEDIHEFLETFVIREIGVEVGGKLHTGRSRNDQVVTCIRMQVRSELNSVTEKILELIEVLINSAEKYLDSLMILYTHTQHAQIGTFSHYLLAYVDSLIRSIQRIHECYTRVNLSPLGAGPIGGSSLDVNRVRTASLLGFEGILENSIDAISSRDFALETASILSILMSELSRIAEDIIIWSSAEFGYIELADEYASASSIMPQKKNPCTLELVRGKTGKIYGALIALLTTIKGLPTGYNRDLQETKPPLWISFDDVKASLEVLTGVFLTLKIDKARMQNVATESYVIAIDLAERLVKHTDLSFREAHKLVGNLVKEISISGIKPIDLKPEIIENLSKRFLGKKISVSADLIESVINLRSCLQERKTLGSPSHIEVNRMLKASRKTLNYYTALLASRVDALEESQKKLIEMVKMYISEYDST